MYLLNAVHVRETVCFSHWIHGAIDGIMEDLKETYKENRIGAPENFTAKELKRDMEEAANFKGAGGKTACNFLREGKTKI